MQAPPPSALSRELAALRDLLDRMALSPEHTRTAVGAEQTSAQLALYNSLMAAASAGGPLPDLSALSDHVDLSPLMPKIAEDPKTVWDTIARVKDAPLDLNQLLTAGYKTQWLLLQATSLKDNSDSGRGYEKYLQYPSARLQNLSNSIVSVFDSNDEKVYKIEQWVQDNITYRSDSENYGELELWAYPEVTVLRRSGDCEDGAFLLHSLALHARVPEERLRTYGGVVFAGDNAVDGHAWTSYQRETDDEWVITDWCYWPKETPIAQRKPIAEEYNYIDDYFFIQASKTVETPYTNRVRYAAPTVGALLEAVA